MANVFQKFIYNTSIAAPILIVFAVVWLTQKNSWTIPIICFVVAIIVIACLMWTFSYAKKNLALIEIHTSDISPVDGWGAVYIITYILPCANIVIDEWNIVICTVVGFALVVITAYASTVIPNPILLFRGYHFYSVAAENGISGYILISKRNLRNKQQLVEVNRFFEYLLLDTEE